MKLAIITERTQCPHRTNAGDGWGPTDLQFCDHPRSSQRRVEQPGICEGGSGFPKGCPLPDAVQSVVRRA